MWIHRVRVNGGFLAGFDMELSPALNVIIGPRGTGKTTLLELVRHALGVSHANQDRSDRRKSSLRHLLGPGEVIVELRDDVSSLHVVVDADGNGRASETPDIALVLGQNELEAIASDASSRLRLVDLRASISSRRPDLEAVRSQTLEIAALRLKLQEVGDRLGRRSVLERELELAVAEEQRLLSQGETHLTARREALRHLEAEMLNSVSQTSDIEEYLEYIAAVLARIEPAAQAVNQMRLGSKGLAVEAAVQTKSARAESLIAELRETLLDLKDDLVGLGQSFEQHQNVLRVQSEPIRAELEAAEAGLGQVTARLRNLSVEVNELARETARHAELTRLLDEASASRDRVFRAFEEWQEEIFQTRRDVAQSVSDDLERRVVVRVSHMGNHSRFERTLNNLLQGSGTQYRTISATIARSMLPQQLLSSLEANDIASISAVTGLPMDRVVKIAAHLSYSEPLAEIASCSLDDEVDFLLRDGASEKHIDDLSTGQKCAVTLPVVLTERSRILMLDQPEDHLDNAYLVRNVVSALRTRKTAGAQTFVATHNANIPVLGEADKVIALASDGEQGFVSESGPFDSAPIVKIISNLMEGGRDAFQSRADFYRAFGDLGA